MTIPEAFDLGDGLDLAGCDDGAGDVVFFHLCDLGGLNLGVVAARDHRDAENDGDDKGDDTAPYPEFPLLFSLCGQGQAPMMLQLGMPLQRVGYARRCNPVP